MRISEPPSTKPDGRGTNINLESIYLDPWDDEDTQPGLGPVTRKQENKMATAVKSKENDRSNLMFVFGRYREGFNLNVVVARDKGFKGATRTAPRYKMLNINNEFPIILPDGGTSIIGEVYEIELRTFDFMDKLEECPSTQGREIIQLENGMWAHMYMLPKYKAPHREEEIPSGDWVEWKRNERIREKDKKEKFLTMMAKGKAEAARRRVLEEEQEALETARGVSNPTSHAGRLWNPIRAEWEVVQPSNDVKKDRDVTIYSSAKSGKKVVHVSDVDMNALRARLVVDGQNVPTSDSSVRAKIMSLYGVWFEVD